MFLMGIIQYSDVINNNQTIMILKLDSSDPFSVHNKIFGLELKENLNNRVKGKKLFCLSDQVFQNI